MEHLNTYAAVLFHILISLLVWHEFESVAAFIYAASAFLSSLAVDILVFKKLFVRFYPADYFGRKSSLPRLMTEPVLASANILFTFLLIGVANIIELFGGASNKLELIAHASASSGYEALKRIDSGIPKPELDDSFSGGIFYIADQLSSVFNIPVLGFTIASIIFILILEIVIYIVWRKIKK